MSQATHAPGDAADAERAASLLGLSHVASCSFLASRLAPSLQFWAALGGGVALARAAARHGLRDGYGASLASLVQTVALIGPARINVPLTQALNAPTMGRLQEQGAPRAVRLGAGLAIRLAHYAVLNVLGVILIFGGLHEYVQTYDKIADGVRVLPNGTFWALFFTALVAVAFALFYTTIQLLVYERAFADWPDHPHDPEAVAEEPLPELAAGRPRVPVAGLLLTVGSWIAVLVSTDWPVLGVTAGVIGLAALVTRSWRAGREVWGVGLILAAVLAVGAMIPALLGAVEVEGAGQRAIRIALLVLSATWLRAVAGAPGMREAARRTLRALSRLPAAREAAMITERLESDKRLIPAARGFLEVLGAAERRPGPLADALVDWVAAEAAGYRPPPPPR